MEWIRHFNKYTVNNTAGQFRLLLLDGFSAHIEYDFVEFALHNRIILFTLPPHSTHFLQPLDVVCFQPLKHYHGEAIDYAVRTGNVEFNRIDFLAAFEGFRRSAFKTTTVLSAFRKTGIIPHNPQRVIAFLEEKQATNQPEDTEEEEEDIKADSDEPITPQTVSELHKAGRSFLQQLEEAAQLSPSVKQNFNRYLKGVTTRLDFGAQIEEDYTQSEAAQKARKKRQTPSQRQISGGGILSVEEARRRIKQRLIGDEKAEIARMKKLGKRLRKPFFAQFQLAATLARLRVRRLRLLAEYHQDI